MTRLLKNPTNEIRCNVRFYFDPDPVNISTADKVDLFRGDSPGGESFFVRLGWVNNRYAVKTVLVADDNSTTELAWIKIDDATHCIEIEWVCSGSEDSDDRWIILWINGILSTTLNSITYGTRAIGFVQMAIMSRLQA